MDKQQESFLSKKNSPKYKNWATGCDEMYKLMEWDRCSSIDEIKVWHYHINIIINEYTGEVLKFDYYPGKKLIRPQGHEYKYLPFDNWPLLHNSLQAYLSKFISK